jgi:hypothetical protein
MAEKAIGTTEHQNITNPESKSLQVAWKKLCPVEHCLTGRHAAERRLFLLKESVFRRKKSYIIQKVDTKVFFLEIIKSILFVNSVNKR